MTIDSDVAVEDELSSGCASWSDTKTINDVVEASFEQLQQYFTFHTLGASSFFDEVAELFLQNAIGVFSLLFFAQLSTVLRTFTAFVYTVLTRGVVLLSENLILPVNSFAEFASDF